MSKIKGVLFDVDGTLLDTTEFILQAYEHTLHKHGILKGDFREQMKILFGKTLHDCYTTLAPGGNVQELCLLHNAWQSYNGHMVLPYPPVIGTIKRLQQRGIRLGAVTNRTRQSSHTLLGYSDLGKAMEFLIGYEDVAIAKPHPEGILKALEIMKTKPGETMMVGDSEFDILAGKAAGVVTVGVRTGLHPAAMEAARPEFVLNSMDELLDLL